MSWQSTTVRERDARGSGLADALNSAEGGGTIVDSESLRVVTLPRRTRRGFESDYMLTWDTIPAAGEVTDTWHQALLTEAQRAAGTTVASILAAAEGGSFVKATSLRIIKNPRQVKPDTYADDLIILYKLV